MKKGVFYCKAQNIQIREPYKSASLGQGLKLLVYFLRFYPIWMNLDKQHAKLLKLQAKADACTSRKEALKILKKSDKAIHKLSMLWTTD
ncbi:hypothetical protein [Prochlorococcus marinus]|uniref:hypothetical protein n=1 Tax=Prochlorococcus marinus TaxID=1219 RepID=UPI0022B30A27|nr:hypothetical protein [Prochlorococcus marinus]